MSKTFSIYLQFTLALLCLALLLGVVGAFSFLYPEISNKYFPFYQLRPMHVSGALFWIISGAAAGILFYKKDAFRSEQREPVADRIFMITWMGSIVAIFCSYMMRQFGGREYWEFPPFLCVPVLISWGFLMYSYFSAWKKRKKNPPLYVWMWTTGIVFFMITFLEQNLYQIPWFRQSFLRDITVQWKSNGAMVGAWNQMIYGTSLFIMVRLAGDEQLARNKKAVFFYFLGVTNLMFNWGHHIYNVPTASWIRHVSYAVSMTEWILLVSIIRDFRQKVRSKPAGKDLLTRRFLVAGEYWVLANLVLAIAMSIPAINRYTHGTHITVAHSMGATIGINTIILLSSVSYILKADSLPEKVKRNIRNAFTLTQFSLVIFWISLIAAGVLKAYHEVGLQQQDFRTIMEPVFNVLHVFAISGIGVFAGLSFIAISYLKAAGRNRREEKGTRRLTSKRQALAEKITVQSQLKVIPQ